MLLPLCMILSIASTAVAASLPFGEMQIKGTGTVSADHASMDIHLEITNNNMPQPTLSQPVQSAKPLFFKTQDEPDVKAPVSFANKPDFGMETAQEFIKSALDSHNQYRAIHSAPPLKLNLKMTEEAEAFAKKLATNGAKNQPMAHEDQLVLRKENEGENLAAGGGNLGGLTGHGAVKSWYKEVCSYDWRKGGYEPQASHFMQLIWKSTTDLGIGKAEGMKHGRPYTYIVARYRPAIGLDAFENVLKGSFNPTSFCKGIAAFSQSDGTQNRTNSRLQPKLTGRFPEQPNYFPNKPANFRTLASNSRLPSSSYKFKKSGSYPSISQPKYGKYRNGYVSIANNYPYGKGQPENDKLSYYAGNARGATKGERLRLRTTSSEYFPKQAEVLEEFVEGDDPTGKREHRGDNNNPYRTSGRFIPVMNSEDAEIDDDNLSEDDLQRKAHVPKHSN